MNDDLPQAVKACLWSYDTSAFDLGIKDNRIRLIENVLNHGTHKAVQWLLSYFSKEEIQSVIKDSSVSVWDKKSLALWSMVFDVYPSRQSRFV